MVSMEIPGERKPFLLNGPGSSEDGRDAASSFLPRLGPCQGLSFLRSELTRTAFLQENCSLQGYLPGGTSLTLIGRETQPGTVSRHPTCALDSTWGDCHVRRCLSSLRTQSLGGRAEVVSLLVFTFYRGFPCVSGLRIPKGGPDYNIFLGSSCCSIAS